MKKNYIVEQYISSIKHLTKHSRLKRLAFYLLIIFLSQEVYAGGGGDAFSDVWDTLKEWTQGTLGRIVAGAMVLVGIVGGIARQSLMAFALGIGGGMGLYNTPTVVESVLSATMPDLNHITIIESVALLNMING